MVMYHQREDGRWNVQTPTAELVSDAPVAQVYVEALPICTKMYEDFTRRKREKGGLCECGHMVRDHQRGELPPQQPTPMAQLLADASALLDCLGISLMWGQKAVDEKKLT